MHFFQVRFLVQALVTVFTPTPLIAPSSYNVMGVFYTPLAVPQVYCLTRNTVSVIGQKTWCVQIMGLSCENNNEIC